MLTCCYAQEYPQQDYGAASLSNSAGVQSQSSGVHGMVQCQSTQHGAFQQLGAHLGIYKLLQGAHICKYDQYTAMYSGLPQSGN